MLWTLTVANLESAGHCDLGRVHVPLSSEAARDGKARREEGRRGRLYLHGIFFPSENYVQSHLKKEDEE